MDWKLNTKQNEIKTWSFATESLGSARIEGRSWGPELDGPWGASWGVEGPLGLELGEHRGCSGLRSSEARTKTGESFVPTAPRPNLLSSVRHTINTIDPNWIWSVWGELRAGSLKVQQDAGAVCCVRLLPSAAHAAGCPWMWTLSTLHSAPPCRHSINICGQGKWKH